ncbi:MAG: hypothetical protein CM1200mP20_17300 [Pseudomonadota bacterium]|nr:MAG: hypothetical protein CM1200mP20_17300 [Pseudomonadota bacterium]
MEEPNSQANGHHGRNGSLCDPAHRLVYSHVGHNFLKTMLRLAETQSSVRVVADQTGPHLRLGLAQATVSVVNRWPPAGRRVWPVSRHQRGRTTWHGFASRIFPNGRHENMQVEPITTDEYPPPAPRPAYSVLAVSSGKVFVSDSPNLGKTPLRVY